MIFLPIKLYVFRTKWDPMSPSVKYAHQKVEVLICATNFTLISFLINISKKSLVYFKVVVSFSPNPLTKFFGTNQPQLSGVIERVCKSF